MTGTGERSTGEASPDDSALWGPPGQEPVDIGSRRHGLGQGPVPPGPDSRSGGFDPPTPFICPDSNAALDVAAESGILAEPDPKIEPDHARPVSHFAAPAVGGADQKDVRAGIPVTEPVGTPVGGGNPVGGGSPANSRTGAPVPFGAPPSSSPVLTARSTTARVGATPEVLDGSGTAWEADLGDRPAQTTATATLDPETDDSPAWATDLDTADGWVDEDGLAEPVDRRRRLLLLGAGLGVVALGVLLSVAGLFSGDDDPPGRTIVLGRRLSSPVAVTVPDDALTTVDDSYVGLELNGGDVIVSVPEQVVEPDGTRAAMPTDPAGWLRAHPDLFISAEQTVRVGGQDVVQIDYRRSALAEPRNLFARVSLFCNVHDDLSRSSIYRTWASSTSRECSQVTSNSRVRATLIPVEGRTVLVEAIWRPYGVWGWKMPQTLEDSYDELLAGLAARPAGS